MGICMLCARRTAVVAALAGGFMIAVAGAGLCAEGVVWSGGVCVSAVQSGLAWLTL